MTGLIFAYTDKGRSLADKLQSLYPEFTMGSDPNCKSYDALIFIGAVGIAVRKIAPLVKDKLTDPAVLCIDEKGQFVIPILSGHVGGANELAYSIASDLGAIPVITTATDINEVMAIDELAAKNGLEIKNRDNIKKVSGGLLKGIPQNITLSDHVLITGDESELDEKVLGLIYRPVVVGMGLRRGKSEQELEDFLLATLEEAGVDIKMLCAIASIDLKADEEGLLALGKKYDIPLVFYSAKELELVEGEFEESDFVKETVGVSDVSARAAKAAGVRGNFILKKKKQDGMTISIFEKYRRVTFEY